MPHESIQVEQTSPSITSIILDRPKSKNALTLNMYTAMTNALHEAQENPEVRVVIIRSAHSFFTSGNDLQDFMQTPPSGDDSPVYQFLKAIVNFPKPLIAAVDGWAVGIGTTMLLHCDLVYATTRAKFKMPFANLALVPEAGASLILPRMFGHQRAAELLMLGKDFPAQQAYDFGIVNEVCEPDALQDKALEVATTLSKLAPEALRLTKMLIKKTQHQNLESTMEEEATLFIERLQSSELAEAISAFFEKREPKF